MFGWLLYFLGLKSRWGVSGCIYQSTIDEFIYEEYDWVEVIDRKTGEKKRFHTLASGDLAANYLLKQVWDSCKPSERVWHPTKKSLFSKRMARVDKKYRLYKTECIWNKETKALEENKIIEDLGTRYNHGTVGWCKVKQRVTNAKH